MSTAVTITEHQGQQLTLRVQVRGPLGTWIDSDRSTVIGTATVGVAKDTQRLIIEEAE